MRDRRKRLEKLERTEKPEQDNGLLIAWSEEELEELKRKDGDNHQIIYYPGDTTDEQTEQDT